MTWTELQDGIAQHYCGTVLVLDDEIHRISEHGEAILDPIFLRAKKAFEDRGMLCDLRQIDNDFDDEAKVTLIEKQLSRCDTVVIDWYLGSGKDTIKDPSNALRVLEQMSKLGGFRFAIIQSKETAETIVTGLKAKFESGFSVVTVNHTSASPDTDTSEIIAEDEQLSESAASETPLASSPTTYRLTPSMYVSVVSKERNHSSVVDIPQFFLSGLKAAYPDHLHWVGFEFASRVRELLPKLLETLPKGTDPAMVFQALLQGKGELGDSLVEAFTEEIAEMLRTDPLLAANDETLIKRISGELDGAGLDNFKQITTEYLHRNKRKSEFDKQFGAFTSAGGQSEKKSPQRLVCDYIANALVTSITEDSLMIAHSGYASLREHFRGQPPTRLYPGVVLRTLGPSPDGQDWLLCLSPACDCARGEGERDYLFVYGQTIKSIEPETDNTVQTCIADVDACNYVKWSGKRLITKRTLPSMIEGYTFHTRLRDDFVRLLVQKVFGWQTRAGVNSSEYFRIMRSRS